MSPVNSPFSSLSKYPPTGLGVSLVIPAASSTKLLAKPEWIVCEMMNKGFSGAI